MGLDKKTRQLFLETILEYQRCFTLLAAYDAELRKTFRQNWISSFKKNAERLVQHPAAKGAVGQQFADLFQVALQGLDEKSSQTLIENARRQTSRGFAKMRSVE